MQNSLERGEVFFFLFFSRYCILFSSSSSYVDLSLDTLTYMFSFSLFFIIFFWKCGASNWLYLFPFPIDLNNRVVRINSRDDGRKARRRQQRSEGRSFVSLGPNLLDALDLFSQRTKKKMPIGDNITCFLLLKKKPEKVKTVYILGKLLQNAGVDGSENLFWRDRILSCGAHFLWIVK